MYFFPKIGIIGGGQLGRMLIESGLRYNVEYNIVDPDAKCPAHHLADKHIIGSMNERAPLFQLADISDVLTYEIEHIDIETLELLEQQGKKLIPSPSVLKTIQNKAIQKQFYKNHHIKTPAFQIVNHQNQWLEAIDEQGWQKCVAKSATGGYDGKGVEIITRQQILEGYFPFTGLTVLEAFIENPIELAVMVARDKTGDIKTWPVVEMEFDPLANLVKFLFAPANIKETVAFEATNLAIEVVNALDGIGVFAVEMFMDKQGNLWVNETAPRPHNSGHHTIEASYTSQYEQLNRILLGLPLGDTSLIKPAAMVNILGAADVNGSYKLDNWEKLTAIPGVYVHMYKKQTTKPNRKLGHVTILGDTIEDVKQKAAAVVEWAIVKGV